ncbi:MAG: hypothetical protein ACRCXD_04660, partial [Luteolibacter sp.]
MIHKLVDSDSQALASRTQQFFSERRAGPSFLRRVHSVYRTFERKRSTEHLSHFCQSSGGYGIYAT